MPLEIRKETYGQAPVLKLNGIIADTDVYLFSRELKTLVKSDSPQVALDVTELEFINSHGLGILAVHANVMHNENRELVIVNENKNCDGYVSSLLTTTGLDNVFRVVSDRSKIDSHDEISAQK